MKKGFRSVLLLIFIGLFVGGLFSQTTNIDSLLLTINSQESGQEKVDNLLILSNEFQKMDIEKCL